MKLWIKDPKTHELSVTLTAFVAGFVVATLKLLLSGIGILPVFSGADFALVVGALGSIYAMRKHTDAKE